MDLDRAELGAAEAGDLDVRRHPDAEQPALAGVDPALLLLAGVVDVGDPQRLLEGSAVVAVVVGDARLRRVGERVGRDQVAPTDLLRAQPELQGGDVEDPVERRGGLGPTCPAERADGSGVGHHGDRVETQARDDVGTLRHHVRRSDRKRATEAGVRPALTEDPHPQAGDGAVRGEAELDVLHLATAMHREHRLAPGLGPLHGMAEPAGGERDRCVVGPGAGLAAEGPADVGRDDADVGGVDADRLGEQVTRHVGVLGGDPGLHPVGGGTDQDRVALDRGRGDALVDHPHAGHMVGVDEDVRGILGCALGRDVGADGLELQGGVVGERLLDVGHRRQVVVVDIDQLGGVHRLGPGLGDDEDDRVTDVADLVDGEGCSARLVVDVGETRERLAAEVVGGVDGEHARRGRRLGGVDAGDPGVCERAADEDGVGDAAALEVVHERALTEQELEVFDTADFGSKDRSGHTRQPTPEPATLSGRPTADTRDGPARVGGAVRVVSGRERACSAGRRGLTVGRGLGDVRAGQVGHRPHLGDDQLLAVQAGAVAHAVQLDGPGVAG